MLLSKIYSAIRPVIVFAFAIAISATIFASCDKCMETTCSDYKIAYDLITSKDTFPFLYITPYKNGSLNIKGLQGREWVDLPHGYDTASGLWMTVRPTISQYSIKFPGREYILDPVYQTKKTCCGDKIVRIDLYTKNEQLCVDCAKNIFRIIVD